VTALAAPARALRCVIVSAAIGAGHDLPAEVLRAELLERRPDAEAEVVDGLAAMGPLAERVLISGSSFHSELGNRIFDVEHRLLHDWGPSRRFAGRVGTAIVGRGLLDAVTARRPDVIVSTYPGTTEVLARLRARGRLGVPVVSAITDLAALRFWAHPGVDVHLVIHAESIPEVRAIAGSLTEVVHVRGLNDPRFAAPPTRQGARRALGLPAAGTVVAVSGGGWGVGDLEGATAEALELPDATAVVLCGQRDALRDQLEARFGATGRLRTLGFTDAMPDVLAAADVLVHSTAGLTVLEALAVGCPVVSYGWGRGHIRANNAAYRASGLAEVAEDRAQLAAALRRAVARRGGPDAAFAELPTAAEVILERFAAPAPAAPGAPPARRPAAPQR
jgi:UDP-N-acetylglucosamine:LPS N-acetylglucosamine transferase